MNAFHMSRRSLLTRSAVITGAAIAASLPASQAIATPRDSAPKYQIPSQLRDALRRAQARQKRVLSGQFSQNGWEIERVADNGGSVFTRPVPGTPLMGVAVRMGDVETVLVHVIRRFHYEIDELRKGDVIGWRSPSTVHKSLPESNQASGTAIQIRPGHYPAGSTRGFYPQQLMVIRDILAELEGVVRWGGDDLAVDEALFYLDVAPKSSLLSRVAKKIWIWNDQAGKGAGAPVDVTSPSRRAAAKAMQAQQR